MKCYIQLYNHPSSYKSVGVTATSMDVVVRRPGAFGNFGVTRLKLPVGPLKQARARAKVVRGKDPRNHDFT